MEQQITSQKDQLISQYAGNPNGLAADIRLAEAHAPQQPDRYHTKIDHTASNAHHVWITAARQALESLRQAQTTNSLAHSYAAQYRGHGNSGGLTAHMNQSITNRSIGYSSVEHHAMLYAIQELQQEERGT